MLLLTRTLQLVIGLLLFFGFVSAPALAKDFAEGELIVNGKTVQLIHAYAVTQKGFFDPKKEDVKVILTDVPVPEDVLSDDNTALDGLALQGKLHGVRVVLDSEKNPVSGSIYHSAFKGSASMTGMHKFTPKIFDGKTIAGTLAMAAPDDFMGVTFQYNATFEAVIRRPPVPTFSGSEAVNSAPGQKAVAYYKAILSGNVTALKQCLVSDMAKQLDGPQGKEIIEMLKAMTPANIQIVEVTISGTSAVVRSEAKEGDTTTSEKLKLLLLNGQWKVTQ